MQTSSDDQYGGGRLYYNRDNNRDGFKSRQSYQPRPNNDYVKLDSSADQQSTIDYLKAQIDDLKAERRKDEAQRRNDEAQIKNLVGQLNQGKLLNKKIYFLFINKVELVF